MMGAFFDRMGILKALVGSVSGVSANVFVNDRPDTVSDQMEDFAVVAVTGAMNDRTAYGDSHIQISLFARDRAGGIEATDRLEAMQRGAFEMFPMVNGWFTTYKPRLVAGGSDRLGFHFLTIVSKIVFT